MQCDVTSRQLTHASCRAQVGGKAYANGKMAAMDREVQLGHCPSISRAFCSSLRYTGFHCARRVFQSGVVGMFHACRYIHKLSLLYGVNEAIEVMIAQYISNI